MLGNNAYQINSHAQTTKSIYTMVWTKGWGLNFVWNNLACELLVVGEEKSYVVSLHTICIIIAQSKSHKTFESDLPST
jgi:hypothetical protein